VRKHLVPVITSNRKDIPMDNSESRRRFLRTAALGAAAAATTLPVVPAVAGQADPIFAVIEAHKRADALGNSVSDDDASELWSEAYHEACVALFTTKPTSLAGVAAVLEYVNRHEYDDEIAYSILANTSFECLDEELTQASRAFLPMIASVVRDIAASTV
jgi:hypothetical protein